MRERREGEEVKGEGREEVLTSIVRCESLHSMSCRPKPTLLPIPRLYQPKKTIQSIHKLYNIIGI